MTQKRVEFKTQIVDFDKDAWERLKAARSAVDAIEKDIVKAYEKSDRLKAVLDLTGFNDFAQKANIATRIETTRIVSQTLVDLADEKAKTYTPPLNLGEKTINALLSGKLLTDDQKKALLKRIGVDLDTLSEKAGA